MSITLWLFSLLLLHSQCRGQEVKAEVSSNTYDMMLSSLLSRDVPEVDVVTLSQSLHEDAILLDARERQEYEVSHLYGARLIGYDFFDINSLSEIDKDEQIVVYCSIGYRSEQITKKMRNAGYTNVSNLYGGIFEWKNTGHEVSDMDGEVTEEVHAYNRVWGVWLNRGKKVY